MNTLGLYIEEIRSDVTYLHFVKDERDNVYREYLDKSRTLSRHLLLRHEYDYWERLNFLRQENSQWIYIPDIEENLYGEHIFSTATGKFTWKVSPSSTALHCELTISILSTLSTTNGEPIKVSGLSSTIKPIDCYIRLRHQRKQFECQFVESEYSKIRKGTTSPNIATKGFLNWLNI